MKKRNTRRALLLSVLSLLLCMSMLIGTTFAWFTDSVTSSNNIIKSGNLDIELYWSTDASDWQKVTETTNVFSEELWEPGHTEVVYLKVANEGSLALKYHLGINVVSETTGTNAAGKPYKLSNYIRFGIVETEVVYTGRDEARAALTETKLISAGLTKAAALEKTGDTNYIAMVVYMPESVGNEANPLNTDVAPAINLGINLVATQYTYESDSFDDQYDADALPCDVLATPETINDVLANAEPGEVIGLADGTYDQIVLTQNDQTLVSNSAVVGYVNLNAKDNCKLIGLTFDAAKAQPAYKMTGKAGQNSATGTYTNVAAAENSANGADNAQIINCTFSGEPVDAETYIPIAFYERNRQTGSSASLTVDGCTFATEAKYYIYAYYIGAGDHVVRNNIFGDGNKSAADAVYFGATKGNVSVIDNIFIDGAVTVTPHNNESCSYALKVSVVENHFFNTTDADMNVIGLRAFHKLPKCNVLVKDNVVNAGESKLSAGYESGNYLVYDALAPQKPLTVVSTVEGLKAATDGNETIIIIDNVVAEQATETLLRVNGSIAVNGADVVITTNGVGTEPGVSNDYGYVAFIPQKGADAEINNVTVEGTGFVEVGHYKEGGGNYVINNLTIKDLKTTLVSPNLKLVSAAFSHYGKAEMNNCVITGATCGQMAAEKGGEAFDVGFVNGTQTIANNCTFGKIYLWAQAHVTLNDCEVEYIDTSAITTKNLGKLTIGAGTHVGTVNIMKVGSYKPAFEILDGAVVDQIIYNGTTYTQAEWLAQNPLA